MDKQLELEILLPLFKTDKYAGWKNIAIELITNKECIVAGNECIWIGGIGNFIKTTESKNFIDCIKYEFDKKGFLKSVFAKDVIETIIKSKENYKVMLAKTTDKINNDLTELYGYTGS